MTQSTSCETVLSSIGFYQLPLHWVRDNRHCTLGDVSGHAFSFLSQGSSPAQKRLLSRKTQVCCFTWYVKRRAPEVKSWQCFPNKGSSTCCKIPKESSSHQIPGPGLWHPPCNWKALRSCSSLLVECPKAQMLSRTWCAQAQQVTQLWMTS